MTKTDLFILIDKSLAGNATPEEEQLLVNFLDSFQQEDNAWNEAEWGSRQSFEDNLSMKIRDAVAPAKKSGKVLPLRKWGWAAAAVLVLALGSYLWINRHSNTTQNIVSTAVILPGKEGAILTLADGSQVSLDSVQNAVIALQGGATAKVVNGTLLYEGSGKEVVYNTMYTPRGRQFHLTLPDGTEVWLNNASSIRYPTVFSGSERKVEISGEAYFEVAKNAEMPFRVNVNNKASIEVLGTDFNVNAYANESAIQATLLKGSVRVSANAAVPVMLKPGEQAEIDENIRINQNVDIDKIIAWKNGVFNFSNVPFDAAMRQLERWYDIEVVYEKDIPKDIELNGEITKGVTLNGLLTVLGKIGVKCRLEGRKLLIQS